MLYFDIDAKQLDLIADDLGATHKQVAQAFNRALRRTAVTLQKNARRGLKSELELRTMSELRRRLKSMILRRGQGVTEARMWFGGNDMKVSSFKGRPRNTSTGAEFRGQKFEGAFVAKNQRGKNTIFKRRGSGRLPLVEQTMPVKDQIDVFVEDEIFTDMENIFFRHFRTDLRARAVLGVGGRRG